MHIGQFGRPINPLGHRFSVMTRFGLVLRTNCDPVAVLFLTERDAELGFDALQVFAGKPNPDATQALPDLEGPKVPVDETDGTQRAALHKATSDEPGPRAMRGSFKAKQAAGPSAAIRFQGAGWFVSDERGWIAPKAGVFAFLRNSIVPVERPKRKGVFEK